MIDYGIDFERRGLHRFVCGKFLWANASKFRSHAYLWDVGACASWWMEVKWVLYVCSQVEAVARRPPHAVRPAHSALDSLWLRIRAPRGLRPPDHVRQNHAQAAEAERHRLPHPHGVCFSEPRSERGPATPQPRDDAPGPRCLRRHRCACTCACVRPCFWKRPKLGSGRHRRAQSRRSGRRQPQPN